MLLTAYRLPSFSIARSIVKRARSLRSLYIAFYSRESTSLARHGRRFKSAIRKRIQWLRYKSDSKPKCAPAAAVAESTAARFSFRIHRAPNNAAVEIRLVPDGFMFSPYHSVHSTLHNGLNDRDCFKIQRAPDLRPSSANATQRARATPMTHRGLSLFRA